MFMLPAYDPTAIAMLGFGILKTAIFRQINKANPHTHHDALEFPNGQIVLLTFLGEGQQAARPSIADDCRREGLQGRRALDTFAEIVCAKPVEQCPGHRTCAIGNHEVGERHPVCSRNEPDDRSQHSHKSAMRTTTFP